MATTTSDPDISPASRIADVFNNVEGFSADVVALDDEGNWVVSVINIATREHVNMPVVVLPPARS